MANDAQTQELTEKVTQLVNQRYGGDWTRAFNHYATRNGIASLVDKDDLLELLTDAGVGNWLTRSAWAEGIIEKLDGSHDAKISWEEFQKGLDVNSR